MAKGSSSKGSKAKKATVARTEDGQYPIYDPQAPRDAYEKGETLFFPKVRNWLDKGNLVEAYGKVVSVALFDNEVPYIEVRFDELKKLNKVDLGKDVRKFLLEAK